MPVANTPLFEGLINNKGVVLNPASTTTKQDLFVAGSLGSRIDQISLCSNDTAAVVLNFYVNDGSNDFYIGNVTVVISAGYGVVPKQEAVSGISPNLSYIALPTGWKLKVAANATITAAKQVDVVAFGGDFTQQ